jgi:manganese transport protein
MEVSSQEMGKDIPAQSSQTPSKLTTWWRSVRLAGPGALIAVGYIDPGNWATDLAAGSYAGYTLLFIVFVSSLVAMLLQIMSARLGIATGKDLAQMSREVWPQYALPAWIAAELTIIATDLAEVLGAAIALKLLFSIPIAIGVFLTALDVLILLAMERWGSNRLERLIASFLFFIACGFVYELILAQPALAGILQGLIPSKSLILDPKLLYLAIGIIGATVMPHNLYLHSNLVLNRWSGYSKKESASFATMNTVISLVGAMFLNAALVILAASVFHKTGHFDVADMTQAHQLLTPLLGTSVAAAVFALMLLISGQSATITGTMAGQVVMSGFLRLNMKPWLRRLITRTFALVPALIIIVCFGERSVTYLLISSQVFLSLQLPFAMVSLLLLSSNTRHMGDLVNNKFMHYFGWISAILIILANAALIIEIMRA